MKRKTTWVNCKICGEEYRAINTGLCTECLKGLYKNGYAVKTMEQYIMKNNEINRRAKEQ